jgi:hypothetical protein
MSGFLLGVQWVYPQSALNVCNASCASHDDREEMKNARTVDLRFQIYVSMHNCPAVIRSQGPDLD